MKFVERFWATVTYFVSTISLSHVPAHNPQQHVLAGPLAPQGHDIQAKYPLFEPPGRHGSGFFCNYSAMADWSLCSTPEDRGCWLRRSDGKEFNITTDYETHTPKGITRHYKLEITNGWVAADGQNFTDAKLLNNTYPGPWIQACWGDVCSKSIKSKKIKAPSKLMSSYFLTFLRRKS